MAWRAWPSKRLGVSLSSQLIYPTADEVKTAAETQKPQVGRLGQNTDARKDQKKRRRPHKMHDRRRSIT